SKRLPLKAPFGAPVAVAWTWAGPYLGTNIGYSMGKSRTDAVFSDMTTGASLFASGASNDNLRGVIGGLQGGYNWMATPWLMAGIETDIAFSAQKANPEFGCPTVLVDFEHGQKLEWFGTLRGRFGTTVTPEAVAYVTGGLAVGEIITAGTIYGFDAAGDFINTGFGIHRTRVGWTAGGGVEARLIGNWTGKIEYLHID